MNEQNYLVLQCGAPFIYKPAYYGVPSCLNPNTWNFIILQNRTNAGCISLTKNIDKEKKKCIKLSGNGPVNYKLLSKRLPVLSYDFDSNEELY